MPTASAKALRPESTNGFRVVLAQEWVRERFWVVPAALLVAGVALGLAFLGRIRSLDLPRSEGVYLSGQAPLKRF